MDEIGWHVEPTSKCILECPLCDRTWFYKKFKKRLNHEIDIDDLIKFIGNTPTTILLCGNNGDPIYHSKFHELCKRLKQSNKKIGIHTNGSGKTKTWWQKLAKILDHEDYINFSIDGLEDTNHLYRKNAKWNSIMDAVDIVTNTNIEIIWKFIVFKQNQHQIEKARQRSVELGFNSFRLIKSDRWWSQDLMPDEEYVDNTYKNQIAIAHGDKDNFDSIEQQCMKTINGEPNKNLYIDAEGNFYPCCKIGTYAFRYKGVFNPKNKAFNIKTNTIREILQMKKVKDFFQSTKSYTTADKCCKIHCGVRNG